MADWLTPEQRARSMAAIHSSGTSPEVKLGRALGELFPQYRVVTHDPGLPAGRISIYLACGSRSLPTAVSGTGARSMDVFRRTTAHTGHPNCCATCSVIRTLLGTCASREFGSYASGSTSCE